MKLTESQKFTGGLFVTVEVLLSVHWTIEHCLEIGKEIVGEVARGEICRVTETLQISIHKSVWWVEQTPYWFVLCDLQIFSGGVFDLEQPHTLSLFLFPIAFDSFLWWEERTSDQLFSVLSISCWTICRGTKSVHFWARESVNYKSVSSSPISADNDDVTSAFVSLTDRTSGTTYQVLPRLVNIKPSIKHQGAVLNFTFGTFYDKNQGLSCWGKY